MFLRSVRLQQPLMARRRGMLVQHMRGAEGPGRRVQRDPPPGEGRAATDLPQHLPAELKVKPAVCGLPVAATRGNAAVFQESMKGRDEAAKFAAAVGCPRMTLVASPGSAIPKEEQRKTLRDRLREISAVLARHDVRLGLEFLGSPPSRSDAPWQFI